MRQSESFIEAREYDFLYCGEDVSRLGFHALSSSDFCALKEFALRNDSSSDDHLEIMRLCSPRGVGEAIQLRNFVGTVKVRNGLQIDILPKIDLGSDSVLTERKIFLDMLSALGENRSSRDLGFAHLERARMPLFEVFAGMYLSQASRVVQAGLASTYSTVHAYQQVIKGRIDFTAQVKSSPAHAELHHMDYDEFSFDRAENRLLKATLQLLSRTCSRSSNKVSARRLLMTMEDVPASINVDADVARCYKCRDVNHYGPLILWSEIFLKGKSFSTFHGSDISQAILFPMERLFEDYIATGLKRSIALDEASAITRVKAQVGGTTLFNEGRVRLRPDIIADLNDESRVVLDTKWKRISSARNLSVSDMYQMYAYGKRFGEEGRPQRVILVYPWHSGLNKGVQLNDGYRSEDGVSVDVFLFDLGKPDRAFTELKASISAIDRF